MKTYDETFMKEALKEAQKAYKKGEVPIGCVIVKDGKIVTRAHNLKEKKNDATAHAEILAIKKAAKKLGGWRLDGCEIYVTLEPCSMCAGAIIQSRLNRLIFGAMDAKAGAIGSKLNLMDIEFNHKVEVVQEILEGECKGILKSFFKELRDKKLQSLGEII